MLVPCDQFLFQLLHFYFIHKDERVYLWFGDCSSPDDSPPVDSSLYLKNNYV